MARQGAGQPFSALIGAPLAAIMTALDVTLPHEDNRITLDGAVKDKWGVPAARIDVRRRKNEIAMSKDVIASAIELMEAAGCTNVRANRTMQPPGHCIHEMGGARMAKTAHAVAHAAAHAVADLKRRSL